MTRRIPTTLLSILAGALLGPPGVEGAVHRVFADGTGDFASIASAIGAAADRDTILIGPGTWDESLVIDRKSLSLRGDGPPGSVILDGVFGRRILEIRRSGEPVRLENLVFRRGRAGGIEFPAASGGAILALVSPVRAVDCTFEENLALGTGGAVHITLDVVPGLGFPLPTANPEDLRLYLERCRFEGNRAGSEGGGIFAESSPATLVDVAFAANRGLQGGGLSLLRGPGTLTGCRFEGNTADLDGGAVNLTGGGPFLLEHVDLIDNTADRYGGAMRLARVASATLVDAVIQGSRATFDGGGLSLLGSALRAERVLLSGSVGGRNGGAIWADDGSTLDLFRCTWTGNSAVRGASAALSVSGARFERCLFGDAAADAIHCFSGSSVTAACSGGRNPGSCVDLDVEAEVVVCPEDPRRLCAPPEPAACGVLGHADEPCPAASCETPALPVSWGALKRRWR